MAEKAQPRLRLVIERHATMSPHLVEETWAVAVLDDGTEIRMRHLGDRVEIRGWDPKGECRPPALRADVLGRYGHIVDVSAAESESPTPPAGEPRPIHFGYLPECPDGMGCTRPGCLLAHVSKPPGQES